MISAQNMVTPGIDNRVECKANNLITGLGLMSGALRDRSLSFHLKTKQKNN